MRKEKRTCVAVVPENWRRLQLVSRVEGGVGAFPRRRHRSLPPPRVSRSATVLFVITLSCPEAGAFAHAIGVRLKSKI